MPSSRLDDIYPYIIVISSLVMMILGTGSVYMLVVLLKPICAEFDWPRSVPSIAYSAQYLGAGIGGVFMGHWLDRAGMGKPALLGAVMIGLGAILTSQITNFWHLWLIYGLMMGMLGRATLFSPLMANVTSWFGKRRGFAVGVVGSGQAFSGSLWPPVFQYAIDTYGWRDTSVAYGLLVLAIMVPVSFVFRRPPPLQPVAAPPATGARKAQPENDAAGNPRTRGAISEWNFIALLCVAIVGCCVAMSLPLAHLVSYVSDIGYEPALGARMLAIALLTAAFSSMLGVGALSSRFGGLGALYIFSWTQLLALGLLCNLDQLWGLYLSAFVFGLGYGGILPCYPVIVRENLPFGRIGTQTAVVVLFGSLGMALGSFLGGLSVDLTHSYLPAFAVGVAFNIFNLILIMYLSGQGRPESFGAAQPSKT